jgi:hypothetical protein
MIPRRLTRQLLRYQKNGCPYRGSPLEWASFTVP